MSYLGDLKIIKRMKLIYEYCICCLSTDKNIYIKVKIHFVQSSDTYNRRFTHGQAGLISGNIHKILIFKFLFFKNNISL